MEIFVFLLAGLVVGGLIYYRLNKDKADGGHPLDALGNKNNVQPATAPVVETKPVDVVNAIAEPTKCGCGRSPTGFCVGLHKLSEQEWSVHLDNPNKLQPVQETKVEEVSRQPENKVKTGKSKVTARVKKTKPVEKVPAKKGRKPKIKEPAKKAIARKLKNS